MTLPEPSLPLRILLIEDNPGDAALIRLSLGESGLDFEFVRTERVGQALEVLKSGAIDIVILDLSLPDADGMSGFASVQRAAPQAPVVVLTGLDDETTADQLAAAGAQDYLVKGSADSRMLRRAIRYAIERKRNELKLHLAASIFENTLESLIITDPDFTIVQVNKAFAAMTGYVAEDVVGKNLYRLLSDRHDQAFVTEIMDLLTGLGRWQGEAWYRRKNGEVFPTWQNIGVISDDGGRIVNVVAAFTEITDLKQSEDRLRHLAHHDALTGLPNRLLFHDRLGHALAQANRKNSLLAVMFIDLDRFKVINDTLGHVVGDELLQRVAQILASCIRASDTVARFGGDEFAIILEDIGSEQDAAAVAQKILKHLHRPQNLGGQEFFIGASIGVTVYPSMTADCGKLLQHADVAMYSAKEIGRNTYQFFSQEMTTRAFEQLEMENDLRRAVEQGEFVLFFQPIIELESERINGVEALLRWRHPTKGMVPPARFVPMLEETGLIINVGEWVLREACRQGRAWRDEGLPPVRMAVNISSKQLKHPGLAEMIEHVLEETGFEASCLDLELTESMLLENVPLTRETLNKLAKLGVRFAIDDFGSGSSSLSYLKNFPISTLKISDSFIVDLVADDGGDAVLSAVISLARNLDLVSVAEGVETPAQLEILAKRQCNHVQGYIFSRPLDVDAATAYVRERLVPRSAAAETAIPPRA